MDDDFDPQRATKVAAIVSMGSLLALVGLFAGGGHAAGAPTSSADATTVPTPALAAAPVLTVAAAPVADPLAVTTTTTADTTTTVRVCSTTYTVQAGDFWLLLAGEASVSVDQLYAANGAGPTTALFPGQTICLPDGATVVTTTSTSPPVTAAKPTTKTTTKPTTKPPTTVARTVAPVVTAAQSTHASK